MRIRSQNHGLNAYSIITIVYHVNSYEHYLLVDILLEQKSEIHEILYANSQIYTYML